MRILITGGAGCLGSNLIERYLPLGHDILAIDNFTTGKRQVLPEMPRLTVAEGSVAEADFVQACFARFCPTHVIHSAAAYKDPLDWREDARTNVLGSINVAKAAQAAGVERVVYFQTALCYGRPGAVPIPVDHPTAPFTSYGISKTAGEQYLLQSGLPVVSLRLANVCAPRLAIGPIPTFYKRLKAGQSCFCSDAVRDFLDVSDFFDIVNLVLAVGAPTGAFNVSSGEGHTVKEVFDIVAEHIGTASSDVPIVPPAADDVPAVVLDPAHTERAFGWRARIGFSETIRRQLRWYDLHGISDIYSHLSAPAEENA